MKEFNGRSVKLVVAILIVVFGLGGLFVGVKIFESNASNNDKNLVANVSSSEQEEQNIISIEGVNYAQRKGISTILLIGLDSTGEMKSSSSYVNTERCDFVSLLVFDENSKTCNIIQLNRDSMVEIPVLTVTGEKNGTVIGQLALAHTYGSGSSDSCRNVVDTVENLLYGSSIDHYVCLNMDAIGKANDLIGGVEVEVLDDFENVESLKKGETVTLMGDIAMIYVRGRKGTGDQTNISRMERQKQYMNAFVKKLKYSYARNSNLVVSMYSSISPYMISDCSSNTFVELSEFLSDFELEDIIIPEGESVDGEEFVEFYVDDEDLKNIVIDLMYDEITITENTD